jgi:CheY-specific phosphatase CheX
LKPGKEEFMSDISTLDIGALVSNAIKEIFETMISMEVVILNGELPTNGEGNRLVGSVSFAGDVMGSVNINLPGSFARMITAAMLDMEVEEIQGDEEIHDVIGELCNMIGGDLKSRLCDSGLPCKLAIPSIASGSNFMIEPKGWSRKEQLGLQHQEYTALVEVYLKPGD